MMHGEEYFSLTQPEAAAIVYIAMQIYILAQPVGNFVW